MAKKKAEEAALSEALDKFEKHLEEGGYRKEDAADPDDVRPATPALPATSAIPEHELVDIDIELLIDNELSANEEDTATFDALKGQIEKFGFMEFPVVVRQPDGRYRLIAGHHRKRVAKAKGLKKIKCVVISADVAALLDQEGEFNLVNNMNLVRGGVRKVKLMEIARAKKLDPTKLDIFKFPATRLLPKVDSSTLADKSAESTRKAKLVNLAMRIAQEIATTIVDEKDELVSCIIARDQLACVIRLPFPDGVRARSSAAGLKKILKDNLDDALERLMATTPLTDPAPKSEDDEA